MVHKIFMLLGARNLVGNLAESGVGPFHENAPCTVHLTQIATVLLLI